MFRRGRTAGQAVLAAASSIAVAIPLALGAPSASAEPTPVSPAATTTASVSPVAYVGDDTAAQNFPAAYVSFAGSSVPSIAAGTSAVLSLQAISSASGRLYVLDASGTQDDSVVLLGGPIAVSIDRTIGSSGDDSYIRIKAGGAGAYSGMLANGSDTVTFSFTTTGAPISLALTPASQSLTQNVASDITLTVKDANGNVTQARNTDSVALSASPAGLTIADASLSATELATGTATTSITASAGGTWTVSATGAGTMGGLSATALAAVPPSPPPTPPGLDATGVAKWGGDDSVPVDALPLAPLDGVSISKVDSGSGFACALGTNGRAYCWGQGSSGQLGVGDNGSATSPLAVSTSGVLAGKTVVDISAGGSFACAVDNAGKGYCWGNSAYLGAGSSVSNPYLPNALEPYSVVAGKTLVGISAGLTHACAWDDQGAAYCWGNNEYGQLGDGTTTSRTVPIGITDAPDGSGWSNLSAGAQYTCGITNAKAVYCWGHNYYGKLGDSSTTDRGNPASVGASPDGSTWLSVHAGLGDLSYYNRAHSCATTAAGNTYCWGYNSSGQLGDSSTTNRTSPTLAGSSPDAAAWVDVSVGGSHTCARTLTGTVSCWGSNTSGQLGDGTTIYRTSPTLVSTGLSATWDSISAGVESTCAVTSGDAVACWGSSAYGALGRSSQSADATTPVSVDTSSPLDGANFDDIAVGWSHRCVLVDGRAYCWGQGSSGQLGTGWALNTAIPTAVDTSGVLSSKYLVSIEVGSQHTCAVDANGDTFCWGNNQFGQLGNSSTLSLSVPVAVTKAAGALLDDSVTSLAVAGSTTCALTHAGRVLCWGYGESGQIGNGTLSSRQVPVPVDISWIQANEAIRSIYAAAPNRDFWSTYYSSTFCLTTTLGDFRCWGYDPEAPFTYRGSKESVPVDMNLAGLPAGTVITDVQRTFADNASQTTSTCILTTSSMVYCAGQNRYGEVGDGTTNWRGSWVAVASGVLPQGSVDSIASAGSTVCATDAVGRAYCWGDNSSGQIGDGTRTNRLSPVRVSTSGLLAGKPISKLEGAGSTLWALTGDGPLGASAPGLISAVPGDDSIAVTWSAPVDTGGQAVTGYRIRYSANGGSTWTTVSPDAGGADRSSVVTSLSNGTTYIVQVAAITSAGLGAWSASSSPTTPRTIPGQLTGLQASSGDGRVDLTWSAPGDTGGASITGYTVTVTPSAGSVSVAGTTAAVTGLANGTNYSFTVAAVNPAGTGAPSSSVSSTPEPGPGVPTGLSATPGNTQIDLSWAAPAAVDGVTITGYAIQQSSDGGVTWSTLTTDTGSTTTSRTASSLSNGTTYWFRVAARAGTRQGLWSTVSAPTTPRTVPDAPPSVAVAVGDQRLSVSWTRPGDGGAAIEGYKIEYSTNAGSTWTTAVADTGSSALSYVLTGLTNGTAYLVRVSAINVAGASNPTIASSAAAPVPDTPISYVEDTSLAAPSQICPTAGSRLVSLTWNAASGAQGYVIEYRAEGGSWSQRRVGLARAGTIDGLTNGNRYEFRVAATTNDNRRSVWGSGCLMSWGSNYDYALGHGRYNRDRDTPSAIPRTPNQPVTAITSGWASSCLVTTGRDPYCWGSSRHWQLGNSWYLSRPWSYLRGLSPGTTLGGAVGTDSACSITTSGQLLCVGRNSSGQLGDGTTTNRSTLTVVGGVLAGQPVKRVSIGENHACAVTTAGRVACWGNNVSGQVDTADGNLVLSPAWVDGILTGQTVADVSVGQTHSCALTTSGRVACWGGDYSGQLGNGSTYASRSEPVWVTGVIDSASGAGETVAALEAGSNHTCVTTAAGRMACWGSNSDGQLGIAGRMYKSAPVWVASTLPTSGVEVISAGGAFTCASGPEIDTYCWGRGTDGQLGNAESDTRGRPQKVQGQLFGANSSALALGGATALAMWGGTATPGAPSLAPRNLQAQASGTLATITWSEPKITGASGITGYRVQQRQTASDPWVTVATTTARVASLPMSADGYWQFRVVPVTDVGEGAASDVVEALRSTGSRSVRESVPVQVRSQSGDPISGTSITWSTLDGIFNSVVAIQTNASGQATLPQLATGPIRFTLSGGTDAVRGISLSSATIYAQVNVSDGVEIVLPGKRVRETRNVTIRMPDGNPVPGAQLTISGGLVGQRQNIRDTGGRRNVARWSVPTFSQVVTADANGQVSISGFRKTSTSRDVSAVFSNGYLQQTRAFGLSRSTSVLFEQMPVVSILNVSSTSVTSGSSVTVTARAVDRAGDPIAGYTMVLEPVTSAGAAARLAVPRSSCAVNPSAVTDASGVAQISLCPGSTSSWRATGSSIVPSTPISVTVTQPPVDPPPGGGGGGGGGAPAPAPVPEPEPTQEPEPSESPSPSPSPSPSRPEPTPVTELPPPGQAGGTVGGVPDPALQVRPEPERGAVVIEGTGFEVSLGAEGSDGSAVDERGSLVVPVGGAATVGGRGFLPAAPVSAYINPPTAQSGFLARQLAVALGDTLYLGELLADDSGVIAGDFDLPSDLPAGDHVLQLLGKTSAGSDLMLVIGISVAERQGPNATIVITGARGNGKQARQIFVTGASTGLAGEILRPWIKLPGQKIYAEGRARLVVADDGSFDWKRRTGKKAYVFVAHESGVRSTMIVVPAAPRKPKR